MKYMGSKSRIAKYIVPIIQTYVDDYSSTYIEPFVGGANVIDKVKVKNKHGFDLNPYLIALLQRVRDKKPLYEEVSKELYDKARSSYNNKTQEFTDWELGNIGFLASYNGRFFDGGYAKPGYEKLKNGKQRYRDYYQEAKNNILQQQDSLQGVHFETKDYRELSPVNCVVYCDPPYQQTKQYANATTFDYKEFWEIMREWSKNNIVLISEQQAPEDFECIWEQQVSRSIKATDKTKATEKLFKYKKGP